MDLNSFLLLRERFRKDYGGAYSSNLPALVCRDGFTLSVQASKHHYCGPRQDTGPWIEVECGFPSAPDPGLTPYAEDGDNLTGTVYGYVPVVVVEALIEGHGGLAAFGT